MIRELGRFARVRGTLERCFYSGPPRELAHDVRSSSISATRALNVDGPVTNSLKNIARRFKQEITVYRRVLSDRRTPLVSKVLLSMAIAYLAMPFDLIPDFIPVVGQLDDLVIIPLLVFTATRFIPASLLAEHRLAVA